MTKNVYILIVGELYRLEHPPVISRVFEDLNDACKYISEKTNASEEEIMLSVKKEGRGSTFLYKEGLWYKISEHVMQLHN